MRKFDSQDVVRYLLSSLIIAFGVFTSKTMAPILWKTIVVLLVFVVIFAAANYKRIRSVQRIIIALAFITVVIGVLGWFLEQTIPDIAVGIVAGYLGGLGLDTLLGKKFDVSHI